MHSVHLINMPFASVERPSIGLMQLQSVLRREFPGAVRVDIGYVNFDLARYLGFDRYALIQGTMQSLYTGFGEWFFRQEAFPDLPGNTDTYFGRYHPHFPSLLGDASALLKLRAGLGQVLEDLIDRYSLADADLVGFTSMFAQNCASIALARRLKQRRPELPIVMGGANCEDPMGRQILACTEAIDFVASGPGLKSFPALVGCLLAGDHEGCHRIAGIHSRRNVSLSHHHGHGAVALVATRTPTVAAMGEELDIDATPALDYEPFLARFEGEFPERRGQAMLPFETSRGCWWGQRAHCTFCGLNGSTMEYRAMAPDRALDLFDSLFAFAGRVNHLACVDNIMPREYLAAVLPKLRTPESMSLFYEVKADLADADFDLLARARVLLVQPGIEAISTQTLKLMKKGTTAFQNLRFLLNCARVGIAPDWNLLIGFPGEPDEVYARYVEDLPKLVHLPPPTGVFPVRFDRYSPYFTRAGEYRLDLTPLDFYELVYPLKGAALFDLAYYFMDRNFDAEYLKATSRWLVKLQKEVRFWIDRWRPSEERPQLRWWDEETVVDSRSGGAVMHSLSECDRWLLAHTAGPTTLDALRVQALSAFGDAAESSLRHLLDAGLLFHEDARVMSLVAPPRSVELDAGHCEQKGAVVFG